jgi:hypothetical protein
VRGPGRKAGVDWNVRGAAFFCLDFFGSFAPDSYREAKTNKEKTGEMHSAIKVRISLDHLFFKSAFHRCFFLLIAVPIFLWGLNAKA